jgi:transposase-like protein
MSGRAHSAELKLAVGREIESGAKRAAPVCREHGRSASLVHRGRRPYAECGAVAFATDQEGAPAALERRVAELERFGRQLAVANAILKAGLPRGPSGSATRQPSSVS